MPRARACLSIEELEALVHAGAKKFVRYEEGAKLYSIGRNSFIDLAREADAPTLTYNEIHRHQSRVVHTRISSNKSPWLSQLKVGDVINVVVSNGEGRFIANEKDIEELAKNGQIATQYVDLEGNATADIHFNLNNSMNAIEGITSPDGRVFGKMGHSER